jgi:hypothetical protein
MGKPEPQTPMDFLIKITGIHLLFGAIGSIVGFGQQQDQGWGQQHQYDYE